MELRDKGYIDWKQQGLNRPNIYFILEIEPSRPRSPSGTPGNSNEDAERTQMSAPDRTRASAPERTQESGQERISLSDYKEPITNKHTVVNDVTANDHERPSRGRPSAGKKTPTISNTALRSKYQLTDEQIGRVHWLVQKQADTLGAIERNHAHYVKRAAEAARDGDDNLLDHKLGDFKQASTDIAVGNKPGYFLSMWREALDQRQTTTAAPPVPTTKSPIRSNGPQPVGDLFRRPEDSASEDPRARIIADAERRGVRVPDYIRTADLGAVGRWWAALSESTPTKRP